MKFNLKIILTLFIMVILIISSIYVIYFTNGENIDNELPSINNVTEDISGKKGEIITICAWKT